MLQRRQDLLRKTMRAKFNNVLVEHLYYYPEKGNGQPIVLFILQGEDLSSVSFGRWIAASRLKKSGVGDTHIGRYILRRESYASLREKKVIEGVSQYNKGELRIWDSLLLENANELATSKNIKVLAEMKFGIDDWDQSQWNAAVKTVGEDNISKIQTLTPESCKCHEDEQNLHKSSGLVPAKQLRSMEKLEEDREALTDKYLENITGGRR